MATMFPGLRFDPGPNGPNGQVVVCCIASLSAGAVMGLEAPSLGGRDQRLGGMMALIKEYVQRMSIQEGV